MGGSLRHNQQQQNLPDPILELSRRYKSSPIYCLTVRKILHSDLASRKDMCKVWATRFTSCKCIRVQNVLHPCSMGYSTETLSCRNDTNDVISITTACPLFCQPCYDHMVLKLRYHYDQLVRETVDEGNLAGWSRDEIGRAENSLRRAQEEELDKLREGCYTEILEQYTES